ncbi:hypothetical protein DFQ26_002096, partial [Actinomortierella ambigua]
MESRAEIGHGIKRAAYRKALSAIRQSTPLTNPLKEEIIHQLRQTGAIAYLCNGEADIGIRRRAQELAFTSGMQFIVIANDVDYCAEPFIQTMLRPWGSRYVEYDINALLSKAGLTRRQFQLLLVVSNTDY